MKKKCESKEAFKKLLDKIEMAAPGFVFNKDEGGIKLGYMEDEINYFSNLKSAMNCLTGYLYDKTDPFVSAIQYFYNVRHKGCPVIFYARWFKSSMFVSPEEREKEFAAFLETRKVKKEDPALIKTLEVRAEMLRAYIDKLLTDFMKRYNAMLVIEDQDCGVNVDNKLRWEAGYENFRDDTVF